jgi:nucleoside-diphosphate-sugar epimerase
VRLPVRLFVFGLGYSAGAFAHTMLPRVARVGGTVRSASKAAILSAEGLAACVFDGTTRSVDAATALADATHVIASVAPGEAGDPVLAHHCADILAAKNLRWIGYLSTVGVYGDYGGAWVSERSTPHPRPGRSSWRLEAEAAWRALAGERGVPLAVFRIAGIYGPGRNALKNLADGKARRIVKPGQVFNRIHVDDIALAIDAALDSGADGTLNLADDEPAPPQDVVAFAAQLMGVAPTPEVPFETARLTPMARSFYGDNKRVSNRRLREELGVALRYPTYREGLTAMWEDGSWVGERGV